MRWAIALALAVAPSMPEQMLDGHNTLRARFGIKPLVWSDKLARAAQEWANRLVKERAFRHRPNSPFGQNLFDVTGGEFQPQQIINGWAAEAKDFNYAANSCREGRMCGHFTQMVWRDTKELGCAVSHGGNREVWVCEYSPPGNYVGERPY